MRPTYHIVFAGGGTGGYLHPGLAVASHVVERLPDAHVTFVGAGQALEPHTVRGAGFAYTPIPSRPPSRRPLQVIRFVTDNVAGFWASRWFLKEQQVSLVVGLGGYHCAATVRAAVARGIPTVLLEQNVLPSSVTAWLSRSARAVCAGFAQASQHLPADTPLRITGNPARPAFEQLYRQVRPDRNRMAVSARGSAAEKRLVVIGGAGGARSLNQFMPRALSRLSKVLDGWRIVHQTGEGQLQETERRYRAAGVEALVVSYIDEMAAVLFESDLVVGRAGGTTLAELALAGTPAILVPYPKAVDASQMANASVFATAGACTVIDETTLNGTLDQALVDQLQRLIIDQSCRHAMADRMRQFARPEASASITDTICDILGGSTSRLAA
jgi:UDP-N-acetylglucosamine--N-acetylmuramyl-(pentapeptide) pyrophosphoryl-undecaprenol N-acetylglucosamine transferase